MGAGVHEFSEFSEGIERQSVRIAWLLFAAQLADEWNIANACLVNND
jgi:hypothetical protein